MTERQADIAAHLVGFFLGLLQRYFSDEEILRLLSQKNIKGILTILNKTGLPND